MDSKIVKLWAGTEVKPKILRSFLTKSLSLKIEMDNNDNNDDDDGDDGDDGDDDNGDDDLHHHPDDDNSSKNSDMCSC